MSGGSDRPGARLLVVVGPSGVGKDSLLAAWRERLGRQGRCARVQLVRRTISRPASAGGEPHEAVSPDEWRTLRDAGAFALHWEAHGLGYGIRPAQLAGLHAGGPWVLLNGSRAALPAVRARFPAARVIEVHARPDTVAARLHARGREDAARIADRLARALRVDADLRIDNDGTLEDAVDALARWWQGLEDGLSVAA
jgi:ribose 1,5-bisphosphokinase